MNVTQFFDLNKTLAAPLLLSADYPWEALDMLSEYIFRVGRTLDTKRYVKIRNGIWIAKSAAVSENADLKAPIIIGEDSEIESGACVEKAIIGNGVLVGGGSEIKNSVIFDEVRAPHHNYISYSIVGYKSSFGAGSIISNMRADRGAVLCFDGDETVSSGRKRFGAIVGDRADIGCSAIISAGTVVERDAKVSPLVRVRGFISAEGVCKGENIISDIL